MNIGRQIYPRYVKARAPRTSAVKNSTRAFLCGGAVCGIGECLMHGYIALGMQRDNAALVCSVTLILVSVLLTALGVFDKIAKFAGAGTLVPITGFANAVASSAMDSRTEGMILGVGAKMFAVSGPVIVYGTLAGAAYGLIYWVTTLL